MDRECIPSARLRPGAALPWRSSPGPRTTEMEPYMSTRSTWALLGVLLLSAAATAAQEQTSGPPPVLAIGQEEIKPGSMGAHDKQVASYLALFNRANVGASRLGLVPVSGDDNQVLYLEGYAS